MKRAVWLLVLLCLPLALGLPDNYHAPVLVANSSGVQPMFSYADSDGIVNGHAAGSDFLFGINKTGANYRVAVAAEDGTPLAYSAHFGSNAPTFTAYDDIEQKVYTSTTVNIYAHDVSNPLAPTLNGSATLLSNTGYCSYYDEAEDVLFCTGDVSVTPTYDGFAYSHDNLWVSDDIANVSCILDKAIIDGEIYYMGIGTAINKLVILDEDFNVLHIITPSTAFPDDCSSDPGLEDYVYLINEDYAIRHSAGAGAKLISLNGFTDFNELAVGCPAGFVPLDAYGQDYIIGFNVSSDTFAVCDATSLTDITVENTALSIGYNEVSEVAPSGDVQGGGRVWLGTSNKLLWDLQEQEAAAAAGAVSGDAPVIEAEFLGVDTEAENFFFKITVTDTEGGNMYYAFDTSPNLGGEIINFNQISDLNLISRPTCAGYYNLSFPNPLVSYPFAFWPYASDGTLHINSTCPTKFPTTLTFDDTADQSLVVNATVDFETVLGFANTSKADSYAAVSFYSTDSHQIGKVTFKLDHDAKNLTVYNSTPSLGAVDSGFYAPGDTIRVSGRIFTKNDTMEITVINQKNASGISTVYIENINDYNTIEQLVFNEFSSSNIETYIDYASWGVSVSGVSALEPFSFYNVNAPGEAVSKSHIEAITDGYGTYYASVYVTDSDYGLAYYGSSDNITWVYSPATPVYTVEQVNNVIAEGVGSGDIITSVLPGLLTEIGATSTGSKMVLGFIILLALAFVVANMGAVVASLVLGTAFIVLSMIGLFPLWFTVIMVIIAAVLVATSFKKILAG